jgi:hypothetical protein
MALGEEAATCAEHSENNIEELNLIYIPLSKEAFLPEE